MFTHLGGDKKYLLLLPTGLCVPVLPVLARNSKTVARLLIYNLDWLIWENIQNVTQRNMFCFHLDPSPFQKLFPSSCLPVETELGQNKAPLYTKECLFIFRFFRPTLIFYSSTVAKHVLLKIFHFPLLLEYWNIEFILTLCLVSF